jgi:hypothetical protein
VLRQRRQTRSCGCPRRTARWKPPTAWAAAASEIDTGNQSQLAGLFNLLKDMVLPEDWTEFRKFTRESKTDDEEFGKFVNAAIEAIAARPTGESAGS